jgi:Asp-tRNA(Asn)/Glu-tRNA(Gln) amidotransferase A subunit family amidase
MGTVEEGSVKLPVGIHFMAPHGGEERLFVAGEMVENRSTH